MRAIVVVPLHPVSDDSPRLLKRLKRVLPDALFCETAKEPFNTPVRLWYPNRMDPSLFSMGAEALKIMFGAALNLNRR